MSNFAMSVSEYMSSPVYAVGVNDGLEWVHERLTELDVSALVVVDDEERPIGLISLTDLLRVGRRNAGADRDAELLRLPDKSAADLMTSGLVKVVPDDTVAKAAGLMVRSESASSVPTETTIILRNRS